MGTNFTMVKVRRIVKIGREFFLASLLPAETQSWEERQKGFKI
jgi:hypothetical protein